MPLFTGTILAVGTFPSMWPLVDGVFAVLCVTAWIAGVRPPKWALLLALPIGISALWSPVPVDGMTAAIRILVVSFAARSFINGDRSGGLWLGLGFAVGLALQTVALAATGWDTNRPPGLTLNAFLLGEAGLTAFMLVAWRHSYRWPLLITSALYIVLSGTRSTALAVMAFGITTRSREIALYAAVITATFVIWSFIGPSQGRQLNPEALQSAAESRVASITGTEAARQSVVDAYGDEIPYQEPRLKLFGYGWGGYLPSTGLQRPHNVLAMLIWELGILAVVPLVVLLWALWRRWLPIPVLIGFGIVGAVSDDLASRPEAQYMLTAVILFGLLQRAHIQRGVSSVD